MSLTLGGVSVEEALAHLFGKAGVKYRLEAAGVQGSVRAAIKDVPLGVALRIVLRQAKPPLHFRLEGDTYVVAPRQAAPPAVPPPPAEPAPRASQPERRLNQARSELEELTRTCGLTVKAPREGSGQENREGVRVQGPTEEDYQFGLPLLVEELQLYPKSLLRRLRLRIVLGRNITHDGRAVGGLGNGLSIFLDLDSRSAYYLRRTIHHELMHAFDAQERTELDQVWATLNAPGARYTGPVAPYRNRGMIENHPGFISGYARTNEREDRAEVFSYLVMDYGGVERRAEKDPHLAAKAQALRLFFRSLSTEMDEGFWKRMRDRGQTLRRR